MIVIADIFADVVSRVAKRYGRNVNFQYGDWAYISKTLTAWSQSAETARLKYPVICLFSPFEEDKTNKDVYCTASLDLLIATDTLPEYSNEKRRIESFDKVLHPVYGLFVEELRKDNRLDFGYKEVIKHRYTDNYRYGNRGVEGPDGNPFKDRIDGIDIKNLEITVRNKIRGGMYGNRI